jgi:glyoxylase-like metal-dependent hydrolase (beta-lactamase superfamily II)
MLANNAFVHAGREPLLVDTGLAMLGEDFLRSLGSVVDPADLRWIWLSHADPDHTGNLATLMALAPKAQVVTGLLGCAKLQLLGFDVSRVRVAMPGDVVEAGDRRLLALRPPVYDAPETLGFHDGAGTTYIVDSFGATLPAAAPDLAEVDEEALRAGMAAWAALDAPWLVDVDPVVRMRRFAAVERLEDERLLTAHVPLGRNSAARLALAAMAACARIPADAGSVERLLPAAA